MKVALDTNVLVYAQGIGDPDRIDRAADVVDRLEDKVFIPMQVIGELFNVLVRKAGYGRQDLMDAVAHWTRAYEVRAADPKTMASAIHLSIDHGFQIWDALIVETARDAGCDVLLSEDMQHGFYWGGLTIINPFKLPEHPLLSDALSFLS